MEFREERNGIFWKKEDKDVRKYGIKIKRCDEIRNKFPVNYAVFWNKKY
ncbi:hypothetical protein [Butyrivibrio fibrisolvens]|nr:hypothetical protein [Butyrivibrio fibrisolvens]